MPSIRERIVLTPLSGTGGPSFSGAETATYRVAMENGQQVFKDRQGQDVDALYVLHSNTANNKNINYTLGITGSGSRFNSHLDSWPLQSHKQVVVHSTDQYKLVSGGVYYTLTVHVSNQIQEANNGTRTSFTVYLIGVDNQAPIVDERATNDQLTRALGGQPLTKDNIESVYSLENIQVRDNVTPVNQLKNGNVSILLSDGEQTYTVPQLKALLSGPDSEQYANKTYTTTVTAADAAGFRSVTEGISPTDLIDKQPLLDRKNAADRVGTASTENKAPATVREYDAAKQEFDAAKVEANRVLAVAKPTAQEVRNAISQLDTSKQRFETAKANLQPSQASLYTPTTPRVERTVNNPATKEELVQAIRIPGA